MRIPQAGTDEMVQRAAGWACFHSSSRTLLQVFKFAILTLLKLLKSRLSSTLA